MSAKFRYEINVPQQKNVFPGASYEQEMTDTDMFLLTDAEYDFLRHNSGIFDSFDKSFGTIIDDCEEDRIEDHYIEEAIILVDDYCKKHEENKNHPAILKLYKALKLAYSRNVFLEFDNTIEY